MKYEFSGMTTEQDLTGYDKYNDFYELYETVLIEKTPFTVELDNKEVKLHLVINDTDMADFDDSTDHIVSVGVIPDFESLSEKNQDSILSQYSEHEQIELKQDKAQLLYDIFEYGFNITLKSETVKDPNKVDYKINSAIATRYAVSGLIGFELDRYVNRIGNTGWDLLDSSCNDADLLNTALARHKV